MDTLLEDSNEIVESISLILLLHYESTLELPLQWGHGRLIN
jgi:hypothetical protein